MPLITKSGLTGIPWHRCDDCDVEYRLDQLEWQVRNGKKLLLCAADRDNPEPALREELAQRKLEIMEPDGQLHPKLRYPPDIQQVGTTASRTPSDGPKALSQNPPTQPGFGIGGLGVGGLGERPLGD